MQQPLLEFAMAYDRALNLLAGCLTKLTNLEMRLLETRMGGQEFVSCWVNSVTANDETKLRASLGLLIASFCQARPNLSRECKYELVKFYMAVAVFRLCAEGDTVWRQRLEALTRWELEAHLKTRHWPWGEQIFTGPVVGVSPSNLREWQVKLMKDNETMEVVQIFDAWTAESLSTIPP